MTLSHTTVMQTPAKAANIYAFHNGQPVFLDRESAGAWLDSWGGYAAVC